ncbi:MAG: Fpg/Nei family DNA glycosylase [Nocardiopsaceae bacterium]|nr:Fpg/Nei family DNA glycosylase [Nocardiopsaceae bacterium]
MPELPEVEALAAFLRERAVGQVIERADSVNISVLKTYQPDLTALRGRRITAAGRHGKFLDLTADPAGAGEGTGPGAANGPGAGNSPGVGNGPGTGNGSESGTDQLHLVMHLARAGWLRWRNDLPAQPPRPGKSPLAFRLRLADGSGFDLTEAGTRKRLAVYLVSDPALVPGVAGLGPDPLADSFTTDVLAGLLAGRRTQIKGLLRDQTVIAGIGNAYSDEILHVAKMSPYKLAASLTEDEVTGLHEAIGTTLRDAVARSAGTAAGELKAEKKASLRVHGRTGQPCPVCGDTVREVSFADSSLQYCPTCQTGGKPLADRRLSRLLK